MIEYILLSSSYDYFTFISLWAFPAEKQVNRTFPTGEAIPFSHLVPDEIQRFHPSSPPFFFFSCAFSRRPRCVRWSVPTPSAAPEGSSAWASWDWRPAYWEKKKKIRRAVSGGGVMGYRENTRVETSNVSGDQRANMGRGRDKKKGMSLFPLEACLWISLISSVRQREANVTVIWGHVQYD